MSLSAYAEIIIASKIDDEQTIVDVFRELHKTNPEGSISLLNIYKELPISNSAEIIDVRGRNIFLETKPLQLAAINFCKEVLIQSPLFSTSVIGRLRSIDERRNLVTVSSFSYAEIHLDKRNAVRVRFQRPLQVMIESESTRISGVISDISLSGCCINVLVDSLASEEVFVQIKFIQQTSGQLVESRIRAKVLRIDGTQSPYRCVLCFAHTPQTEQTLSSFIYQRQIEILNELRESL